MCAMVSGLKERKVVEVLTQIAPIDGGQPVGMGQRMRRDEEVGDQVLPWPTGIPVIIRTNKG